MSVSSYVKGLRAPTGEWQKKRAAIKALVEANEPVPQSLIEYFGEKGIDPKYILDDDTRGLEIEVIAEEGSNRYQWWLEVDLKKLPPGVEKIRFIRS